jgi:hypothetical protein
MIKVITTTSKIKPNTGIAEKSKICELIYAERITIPIFTKLLTTRMVLRRLSGVSRSFRTFLALLDLLLLKLSLFEGLIEKKATSDPEIKAEHINNNSTIIASTRI